MFTGNQLPWRRSLLSSSCNRTSDREETSPQVLQTHVHIWSGNILQQRMGDAWFSLTRSLIWWWLKFCDFPQSLNENYTIIPLFFLHHFLWQSSKYGLQTLQWNDWPLDSSVGGQVWISNWKLTIMTENICFFSVPSGKCQNSTFGYIRTASVCLFLPVHHVTYIVEKLST
jgi:hypothetical protein